MMCGVKRCRCEVVFVFFYNHPVCESCWGKHCDGVIDLKRLFKIPVDSDGLLNVDVERNVLVYDDWRTYFKQV